MRAIVWLLLLFAAAVVAALTLGDNVGMASFYWGKWRLDMSLNFFVLAALGTAFVTFTVVQALNALLGLPARAREWRGLRIERAAQAALREALAEYFAGRFTRSHKAALRALSVRDSHDEGEVVDHEFRMLAQLLAAGSLHRLQDRSRRDTLLKAALKAARRGSAAVDDGARLLAAEWSLDDRDPERAASLLDELQPGVARRTQALRLKLLAARQGRRPVDALRTARLLAKHQAFSDIAAQSLLRSLAFEVLDDAHDIDQLRRAWGEFDSADQRDPHVAARAARRAAALGAADEARQWLRPMWDRLDGLDARSRGQLALALIDAAPGIGADWLARVEAAQHEHPSEGAVQAAAGAVLFERQLWGKARKPLEQAAGDMNLEPRARRQAWRKLAELARVEADPERAAACDRSAAAID